MSKRVTIGKTAGFALAGLMALGAGAAAQAQPYGYNGMGASTYSYDACKRAQTERGTVGALVGGGMGAVIGSNAAARNARTEGSILGGVLGAAVGAVVGNKSAACESDPPPPPPPPPRANLAPPPPAYYDRGAYAERYPDDGWVYGRRGERYRIAEDRGVDPDGCTLAESPIYMPDGRVQTRFVRVCRDSTGRYAVVD